MFGKHSKIPKKKKKVRSFINKFSFNDQPILTQITIIVGEPNAQKFENFRAMIR